MRIPQSGVRTKCPQLFGGVDLATAPQEAFVELQRAHARLMEAHARVSGVWKKCDDDFYDYNKDAERAARPSTPSNLRRGRSYYLLQHLDPRTTT